MANEQLAFLRANQSKSEEWFEQLLDIKGVLARAKKVLKKQVSLFPKGCSRQTRPRSTLKDLHARKSVALGLAPDSGLDFRALRGTTGFKRLRTQVNKNRHRTSEVKDN